MLSELYAKNLESVLVPREHYQPFPTAINRRAWEGVNEHLRTNLIESGEKYLGWQWPSLPATLFMEFRRTGNRSHYERPHNARREALGSLVLAECVEDKGRFLDDIVNGVWCICEESFWGIPAHSYVSGRSGEPLPSTLEPIIDLFAAETAGLLAWTHYLLQPRLDAVSVLICDRIRRETKKRILDPYLERDDFWWMGLPSRRRRLNNWTPWCNSNCLTAALLLEEDPGRRLAAVAKAMRSLDSFLEPYPADGGCDEGTSYWSRAGGSLFDCLELLYTASDGLIDVYDQPLIADIGRYLYRSFISDRYYVNFADGSAVVHISVDLVYRYGRRINDPLLSALGSSAYHAQFGGRSALGGSLLRRLPAIFNYEQIEAATATPPFVRDAWLPVIQFMAARVREGSDKGLYLAAKGGNNAESHNHNDVGQFVVYADGRPVLVDVGVETYTAKTFSSRRYEIWTMQSAYHNLPTVNGVQQQAGEDFYATDVTYQAGDAVSEFSLDIAPAYPKAAGIKRWRRTLRLNRGERPSIQVIDDFALDTASADITLSLLTSHEPEICDTGTVRFGDVGIHLNFDGENLAAHSERLPIDDARLRPVWGDHLYRILMRPKSPRRQGVWELRIEES